ncbi:GNAT family N-acetyltransferase [Hyphococcus luteus]|uniref:GNAT family N-acetyltransferase n=1 Tax=Hyphococcus luteus TaxID=2058213 RepID=UPI001A9C3B17|nr:GNAT family N-acetyltransferase [Marinicaulis flavus]
MTAFSIPILETARLILREHRLEDFPAILKMWSDPDVTRLIGGKPRAEEEVWMKFLRNAGLWAHLGYGYWVLVERDSGAVIGEIGLADFKRDLTPSIKGMPELGYALAPSAHGKGYASEAARAVVAWGDQHLSEDTMSCIISPENLASIRVAEKCGFREAARADYHGDETLIFHRDVFNRS